MMLTLVLLLLADGIVASQTMIYFTQTPPFIIVGAPWPSTFMYASSKSETTPTSFWLYKGRNYKVYVKLLTGQSKEPLSYSFRSSDCDYGQTT